MEWAIVWNFNSCAIAHTLFTSVIYRKKIFFFCCRLVRSIIQNPKISKAKWNAIVFLSRYHTTKYTQLSICCANTHTLQCGLKRKPRLQQLLRSFFFCTNTTLVIDVVNLKSSLLLNIQAHLMRVIIYFQFAGNGKLIFGHSKEFFCVLFFEHAQSC